MNIRHVTGALAAAAVLAVPVAAIAQEEGFLKVTGGGQVIADMSGGGPGDTIAFNAQQTGAEREDMMEGFPAKGELQVINRRSGNGGDQVRFHGNVTCIRTFTDTNGPGMMDDEMYVRFGGNERTRGGGEGLPFTVDVQDNGQGGTAQEDDMIAFRRRGAQDDPCDDSDTSNELRSMQLARGNVKQH